MSKTVRKTTSSKSARSTKKQPSTKRSATKVVRSKTKQTKKVANKKTTTRTSKKRTASAKSTKTSAKKNSTKTTKNKVQERFNDSPTVTLPEHAFWVNDGAVLHSLKELEQALHVMDELVYRYHVSQEKHDFADWVEHVLSDVKCATALRKAETPSRARTIIVTHLKRYSQ